MPDDARQRRTTVATMEARALTGFFRRGPRTPPGGPAPIPDSTAHDVVTVSKVFPRFVAALVQRPAPVLLDLGPVVGSNISYFGERLSCKIFVEDLVADVEAHARRGERDRLPPFFATRLQQPVDSVDGILCWDLFDFLDKPSGQILAGQLARRLRRGGVLYGFFGTTTVDLTSYSRFVVEADDRLRIRPFPATPVRRQVLMTRDINKMFDSLVVAESVLLKSSTRETLFRQP